MPLVNCVPSSSSFAPRPPTVRKNLQECEDNCLLGLIAICLEQRQIATSKQLTKFLSNQTLQEKVISLENHTDVLNLRADIGELSPYRFLEFLNHIMGQVNPIAPFAKVYIKRFRHLNPTQRPTSSLPGRVSSCSSISSFSPFLSLPPTTSSTPIPSGTTSTATVIASRFLTPNSSSSSPSSLAASPNLSLSGAISPAAAHSTSPSVPNSLSTTCYSPSSSSRPMTGPTLFSNTPPLTAFSPPRLKSNASGADAVQRLTEVSVKLNNEFQQHAPIVDLQLAELLRALPEKSFRPVNGAQAASEALEALGKKLDDLGIDLRKCPNQASVQDLIQNNLQVTISAKATQMVIDYFHQIAVQNQQTKPAESTEFQGASEES